MPGPSVFCYYLYCTIAAERRTRYDCHSWYTRIIIYNSRGRKSEFMYPPLQPSSTIIHARVIRTEYAICGKAHWNCAPLLSPRLLRLIIKYIKPRIHKGSYSTVQSLSSNDPLCEWVAVMCRAGLLQSIIYFKVSLVRVLLMNKFQLALLWIPVSANRATAQHRICGA